ncbi:MAG: glycine--tRNA ligase subunit beta [bacterium]
MCRELPHGAGEKRISPAETIKKKEEKKLITMPMELLLEIGVEEIPARFIPGALERLAAEARGLLARNRIEAQGIATYGTPRRLILHGAQVAEEQESFVEEIAGPPKRICYDAQGQPTKAALGFAKNQGVPVEDLQVRTIEGKGEYLVVVKQHHGRKTRELLGDILAKLITSLSFPKVMRWGDGNLLFARPIHWIMAIYGGEVVPLSLDGIESGDLSYGHRFTSPGSFKAADFASFVRAAEQAQVIISPDRRKAMIKEQIAFLSEREGGHVPDDPHLLDLVTCLVEYPKAICGSFDSRFLQLPEEVLVTSMRSHQKYFPVYDRNNKLMAKFIAICNIKTDDYRLIQAGNERVLRARLADAEFFYLEDRKKPLSELVESLKKVVFQEKLGSLYDKVERIQKTVAILVSTLSSDARHAGRKEDILKTADRAAFLCKADLITEMVKEFPELQGIMGREYALQGGETPEVATAIYEHYLPRFQDDELPKTLSGALVGIADKMDNIAGCFGLGMIPTGSEDPYALRRQGQGIVNIILQGGYRLSLTELIKQVIQLLEGKITRKPEEVRNEVASFFQQRIQSAFSAQGFDSDLIEAVLATGDDDVVRLKKKIEAVRAFLGETDFGSLMTSFKRVINIIPKGVTVSSEVDSHALQEEAEKKLYGKLQEVKAQVSIGLQQEDYRQVLQNLAGLKSYIDTFFEEILVMVNDEKLKHNRLSLLQATKATFSQVVDFSKIVAERG